jgi:hypothetical protein
MPKEETGMPKTKRVVPVPVKTDSRICFGISYFTTKADAAAFDRFVAKRGDTYNGGWLHGKPCGRDQTWDHVDPVLGQLYAVTTF